MTLDTDETKPEPRKTTVLEDTDKASSRSAILLLIAVFVVAIYSVSYGIQTLAWLETKSWASASPWLRAVPDLRAAPAPQPAPEPAPAPVIVKGKRPAKQETKSTGTQVEVSGYQFTVPWQGPAVSTPKTPGTEIRFKSGQVILFYEPESQVDTIGAIRASTVPQEQTFASQAAASGIDTNYALYNAVYSASPALFSPFQSVRDTLRLNSLLLLKLQFGFDELGALHSFDWSQIRGFQFGDPGKGPVALRLFDIHDKQFRMNIVSAYGSGATILQADVDQAIQTFAPIPFDKR
ncbi:MAG: hypothetical protein WAL51_06670 [Candidatus Acidiferrales bacterium]